MLLAGYGKCATFTRMASQNPAPPRPTLVGIDFGDMKARADEAVRAGVAKNRSALVRDAIGAYLNPERRRLDPRPLADAVTKMRIDFSRTGSNFNQLAHGFNMHGPVAFDRDALASQHEDLRREFTAIMTKLLEVERLVRAALR